MVENRTITLPVPADKIDRINEIARETRLSKAAIIRAGIDLALAMYKENKRLW